MPQTDIILDHDAHSNTFPEDDLKVTISLTDISESYMDLCLDIPSDFLFPPVVKFLFGFSSCKFNSMFYVFYILDL